MSEIPSSYSIFDCHYSATGNFSFIFFFLSSLHRSGVYTQVLRTESWPKWRERERATATSLSLTINLSICRLKQKESRVIHQLLPLLFCWGDAFFFFSLSLSFHFVFLMARTTSTVVAWAGAMVPLPPSVWESYLRRPDTQEAEEPGGERGGGRPVKQLVREAPWDAAFILPFFFLSFFFGGRCWEALYRRMSNVREDCRAAKKNKKGNKKQPKRRSREKEEGVLHISTSFSLSLLRLQCSGLKSSGSHHWLC